MSKKGPGEPPVIYRWNRPTPTPEEIIDSYLVQLEKLDKQELTFWGEFYDFLTGEREKLLDDILDSLQKVRQENIVLEKTSRIVIPKYGADPLCTYGSTCKPPGGRFNFGSISSFHQDFDCLYVANDYHTAFHEVFHYEPSERIAPGAITPEEAGLQEVAGFNHVQCRVELDSVIDIRSDEALKPFCEVISRILPSKELQDYASALGKAPLVTIQSLEFQKMSLFDPKYKQWGTWLNQPANSQWFGHYVRRAGIQAVIYPSCRDVEGFNVAIFPSNFQESESRVTLLTEAKYIPESRREMNAKNCLFFQRPDSEVVHC